MKRSVLNASLLIWALVFSALVMAPSPSNIAAQLWVTSAPSNDDIENAQVLTIAGQSGVLATQSNSGSSVEEGEVEAVTGGSESTCWTSSVWYKAVLSVGQWRFTTFDATFDEVITIGTVTTSPPSAGSFLRVQTEGTSGYRPDIQTNEPRRNILIDVASPSTYYIGIGLNICGYRSGMGTFRLRWSKIQDLTGDNLADAIDYDIGRADFQSPVVDRGRTLLNATVETFSGGTQEWTRLDEVRDGESWDPQHNWVNSVWSKVTLGAGNWSIVADFDRTDVREPTVALFTSSSGTPTLASLENVDTGTSLTVNVTAEMVYYIGVSLDYEGVQAPGSFDLRIRPTVRPSAVSPIQVEVDSETPSAHVSWELPANSGALETTSYLKYDVRLQYMDATGRPGERVLDRRCSVFEHYLAFPGSVRGCGFDFLAAGTWSVLISVYDGDQRLSGNPGETTFDVAKQWNDSFEYATELAGTDGSLFDNFSYATLQYNEPRHATSQTWSSLWYKFQAPKDGLYAFTLEEQSSYNIVEYPGKVGAYITAYTGESLSTLSQVGFGEAPSWDLKAGTWYRITISLKANFVEDEFDDYEQDSDLLSVLLKWTFTAPAPTPGAEAPRPAAPTVDAVVPVQTPQTSLPPVVEQPQVMTVKAKNNSPLSTVLRKAKIKVDKTSTFTVKVLKASRKICRTTGGKLQFTSKGTCNIEVKVKPKKGKTSSHLVVVKP
jgi:hypothetical protein